MALYKNDWRSKKTFDTLQMHFPICILKIVVSYSRHLTIPEKIELIAEQHLHSILHFNRKVLAKDEYIGFTIQKRAPIQFPTTNFGAFQNLHVVFQVFIPAFVTNQIFVTHQMSLTEFVKLIQNVMARNTASYLTMMSQHNFRKLLQCWLRELNYHDFAKIRG